MSISEKFQTFLENIKVDNGEQISGKYGDITSCLNKRFRNTDSSTANNLQVGSYGRWTAIRGISDLDMIYIMPASKWDDYNIDGGQSKLLTDVKDALKARYPRTDIYVDSPVVRVLYTSFHVEVQPAFEQDDGSFKFPDTRKGGTWKTTKPRAEIKAMADTNAEKNRNLRRLCKMARAWKNKHGVAMGGLLIDTLAHNFLNSTTEYDSRSYHYYDWLSRDFFKYLADEPKQERYVALGSGQHVKVKESFQSAASKTHQLCLKAIDASGTDGENAKWQKVYGNRFPAPEKQIAKSSARSFRDTEEFVEDRFPVDIRYKLKIDCEVTQAGFQPGKLRSMLRRNFKLSPKKSLKFEAIDNTVPGNSQMYWKVLNRGDEAERRDCLRGQIVKDSGYSTISEHTNFAGDHIVECYVVQNGVVVAKDRIHVPIE
ncbi:MULTISPECIES: nucleotide-binding domain-containing protein [Pectobacterium]|uniref:nucleotide-binding domain-containing protein n=1 Tax=Pectobacterium TaxID=122277 RepID=UPI001B37CF50|nr:MULTISPECIES: nucleotidyltransferase [Pectobacterium]MBQ4775589.1 nucleotidyltransferase [Pectobacterium versatile]